VRAVAVPLGPPRDRAWLPRPPLLLLPGAPRAAVAETAATELAVAETAATAPCWRCPCMAHVVPYPLVEDALHPEPRLG